MNLKENLPQKSRGRKKLNLEKESVEFLQNRILDLIKIQNAPFENEPEIEIQNEKGNMILTRPSLAFYKENEIVDFYQAAILTHSTLAEFKTDLNKINNFLGISIENAENETIKIKDLIFFLKMRNLRKKFKIEKEKDIEKDIEKDLKRKEYLIKLEKAVLKFQKKYGIKEYYSISCYSNFFKFQVQNFYKYMKNGTFDYIDEPKIMIKFESFIKFQIHKIQKYATREYFQSEVLK